MILFLSNMMFAQILSLANLNLPNHLIIFTNTHINTLLCNSQLGAHSPVKYIFSFSLKLIVVAVKLISPPTSSFALLVVFWPHNLWFFCWLSSLTVLMFSMCYFYHYWMDAHHVVVVVVDGSCLEQYCASYSFWAPHGLQGRCLWFQLCLMSYVGCLAEALTFFGIVFFDSCHFWFC